MSEQNGRAVFRQWFFSNDELFGGEFPAEMTANLGKRGRFTKKTYNIPTQEFVIGMVQRNFEGRLCYRVFINANDLVGFIAYPDEIEIY